ncbi:hypothetical protein Tco_0792094 [Tanacetum coccineum]
MDKDAAAPIITIKANIDATVKEIRKRIRFRRQEFCLLTGLHFGSNMYMKEWVKNMAENLFRNRIFPDIEARSVKLSDVIAIFDKMRGKSLVLKDNDAVKIWSYIWDYTYPQLRDALNKRQVSHDDKREKGAEIRYTLTGFVYAFMIWILEAIPATHVYVSKEPMEKIPRAFAWKMILPFSWARCRTLFVGDNLAPPLETLTPTKAESESDWWKTSLEYFEGKGVQSEAVSEQLEIEKDSLSEKVQKKKKRKRGSSPPSFQNPTYEQLMTRVSTLEGTVTTLTQTVSSLQGSIDTLESRLLALEGTISTLESRLLALEGDERDFGVVSDGDIAAYISPGPSYTSHGPLHTSPALTAHKYLPLANRRKLRVRRTPLKLKSPMRCYLRKSRSGTIPPPPASTMMPPVTTTKSLKDTHLDDSDAAKDAAKDTHLDAVTTISVPMTTTEKLLKDTHLDDSDAAKDTHLDAVTTISVPMTTTEKTLKDIIHIDASDPTQETGHRHTEDELKIIRIETTTKKPSYDLPDLTKIRRCKYPIFTTFEKKKTDCYLDCLPKGRVCETSFWDILWPGGENVDYLEQGMLDGLHINAFIEVMMRKRPCNAQWTLGHSELVAFYKDSSNLMSMVSVMDVVRATIDGTNPRYPSWEKNLTSVFEAVLSCF